MQVGIYIETDNQIQKCRPHRYGYVMASEYQGRLVTVEGFGKVTETFHGAVLTALNEAVHRLTGKCELFIYARDPYILQALIKQAPEWQKAGWIRANGEPVKHAEIWKSITQRLQELRITEIGTESNRHEYSSWLQGEIKKQIMKEETLNVVR